MCDHEELWRLHRSNWFLLSVLALLLGISIAESNFSIELENGLWKDLFTASALVLAGNVLISRGWGARPGFAIIAMAQIRVLAMLATPLTYVAASANLPLQDSTLAYWDQHLGLDWAAYYQFVTGRPMLVPYACLSYALISWFAIGVPVVLGLAQDYVRLQQFTMACILTFCATAIISTFIPAFGTYHQYALPTEFSGFRASGYLQQMEYLPLVRDGALRVLNVPRLGGIITFPSFHASVAVLALWGFWSIWWMRPFALMSSVGMLLATPLFGGHYFVDVFAGAALAALAIAIAKSVGERSVASSEVGQGASAHVVF
jgi:hypothetical protein